MSLFASGNTGKSGVGEGTVHLLGGRKDAMAKKTFFGRKKKYRENKANAGRLFRHAIGGELVEEGTRLLLTGFSRWN